MSAAAPAEMVGQLKASLEQHLSGLGAHKERPHVLTAIEGLCALAASGALFDSPGPHFTFCFFCDVL